MKTRTRYKLTDKDGCTRGGCRWGVGITHVTSGVGELCTDAWLHSYSHPLLALLLNPIHGKYDIDTMRLWECAANGAEKTDSGLKFGDAELTTLREIPRVDWIIPTLAQRVRFAIYCALEVCRNKKFIQWSKDWLSGRDRTRVSASSAARASWEAASSAAWAAAAAAAAEEEAVSASVSAARAAAEAASAAAWAAAEAAAKANLIELAERAIAEEL